MVVRPVFILERVSISMNIYSKVQFIAIIAISVWLQPELAIGQENQDSVFQFTGIAIEWEDSGLGPYYHIKLINDTKSDSLTCLLMIDLLTDQDFDLLGKKVKLNYTFIAENHLDFLELKSDQVVSIKKNHPSRKQIEGRLLTCTCGDMSGYLDIELANGKQMEFITDFYCPEDIYRGDQVLVYYTLEKEIEVVSAEVVK